MPDYTKGIIYKVWDNNFTKCYIGSTIQPLSKRFEEHRRKYKAFLNGKYQLNSVFSLFDECGAENCKIELLELYSCNSREELLSREGIHQRENECVNRKVEQRTKQQYRLDNLDKMKEKDHLYYINNKDTILERQKQYHQNNKAENNENHRQYYIKNREKFIAHKKENNIKRKNHLQYIKSLEDTN